MFVQQDLLEALGDDDWWVRARATDALARIGGPKVVGAVLELINDELEQRIEIFQQDQQAGRHVQINMLPVPPLPSTGVYIVPAEKVTPSILDARPSVVLMDYIGLTE